MSRLLAIDIGRTDALRGRLTERPTRFAYAIEALDAIVEAAATLIVPPDEPASAAISAPRPPAPPASAAEPAKVGADGDRS